MHSSYNQFLFHSFLSAPHVSNESSRSSSGAQHNILYYTVWYNRYNRACTIVPIVHVSNESSRSSSGARHNILYYTVWYNRYNRYNRAVTFLCLYISVLGSPVCMSYCTRSLRYIYTVFIWCFCIYGFVLPVGHRLIWWCVYRALYCNGLMDEMYNSYNQLLLLVLLQHDCTDCTV